MATLQKKSFNTPDETRTFPLAQADFISFGDMPVVRITYGPGWRWADHVKPLVGTESCQMPHFWHVLSGHLSHSPG